VQPRCDSFEILEKRPDVRQQLFALRCQSERVSVEELSSEIRLEQKDLAADRGLLNAIGNVPHGPTDTSVERHIVEQLEMMNVHHTAEHWQRACRDATSFPQPAGSTSRRTF
jgi:hypothetical protein